MSPTLLRQLLGPVPAVGTTPFFGLALLAGLGLLVQSAGIQHSTSGIATGLRGNALIAEASRYSSLSVFLTLLTLALLGYAANSGKLQGTIGKFLRIIEDLVG